ncbi:MAG: hypothetical protein J5747_00660 [Spirochaetaceae bacterium]|nr:hypothetical protein [Spirochaetaceae bacterium]
MMIKEALEKEAEDSWRSKVLWFKANADESSYKTGFKDGYAKANEWHYVKDGDLPKDEEWKWCISRSGYPYIAKYEELFVSWTNQENKEVMCPYAWKEIVLPELPKEIE